MRKRKYRKRTKKDREKPYIRRNKLFFWGRWPYLRKHKIYFGEGRKELKQETVYLEQFFRQHYL